MRGGLSSLRAEDGGERFGVSLALSFFLFFPSLFLVFPLIFSCYYVFLRSFNFLFLPSFLCSDVFGLLFLVLRTYQYLFSFFLCVCIFPSFVFLPVFLLLFFLFFPLPCGSFFFFCVILYSLKVVSFLPVRSFSLRFSNRFVVYEYLVYMCV